MTRFGLLILIVLVLATARAEGQVADPYYSPAGESPAGSSAAANNPPAESNVAYINTRVFNLPVIVYDESPIELRLFVSANRGETWDFVSRHLPTQPNIPYSAPADGEFWFYLHTLTRQNPAPIPPDFNQPLRLIIDSQRPILDATASPADGGGVLLGWSIEDLNADPAAISIAVRPKVSAGPEANWETVALPAARPGEDPLHRQILIWPQLEQRVLEFQFITRDRAGNQSQSIREVQQPWQASGAPVNGGVAQSSPLAARPVATQELVGPRNIPWNATPTTTGSNEPTRSAFAQSTPNAEPAETRESWGTTVPNRDPNPESRAEQAQRLPVSTPGVELGTDRSMGGTIPAMPASTTNRRPPLSADADRSLEELPPPISSRQENPVASEPAFNGAASGSFASGSTGRISVSEAEFAQVISSPRFRLSYDVDSVGTQGVAKVQLWMTEDGGDSWSSLTEDPDCESPISVELPHDGTFGFHLVVTARNGLAGEEPRPGQTPDMWVVLDQTAPDVELVDALIGEGSEYGKLILRWTADDEHLGKRAVTLKYSESANGPWQVIAAGLENTGDYAWTIVPSLPRYFYVRVEVTDRGGNLGSDVSPLPVDLSSFVPRGNLRGFVIDPANGR